MSRNINADDAWVKKVNRFMSRFHSGATLENSSITNGRMRFIGGLLLIDSGGTLQVIGQVNGQGQFRWVGPWEFDSAAGGVIGGDVDLRGDFDLTGRLTADNVRIENGNIYVGVGSNQIVIEGSTGRIIAGPVVLDRNGSYGGRLSSTSTLLLDAVTAVVLGAPATVQGGLTAIGLITGTSMQSLGNINALGNITAIGDIGGGSKSFWIDHPTKPGKQLRHGSLEGPEHGVYYRGVVQFDADGEALFELPEYFTPLVLGDDEPTVQVTPIGRPFLVGAERVADGAVKVYGETGREANITVTAAREHFEVEPDKKPVDPIASDCTPPTPDEQET